MNAVELLRNEHEQMRKLLKDGEKASHGADRERRELLATLRTELQAHERIEEEIFYPALRKHERAKELVLESFEEHHVVDTILGEIEGLRLSSEQWPAKFKVMTENIEHHIEEEETQLLPMAERLLKKSELDDLGARMAELREAAAELSSR